ncbi:uncharacterized protein LOC123532262 [Mercenaria mercenaria]|uniref:uncharacterized protein LOC123532262 n=1 Tax=Mercenaria mercenaria TaxID=6596 RepID=UPI00234E6CFE|nr:uncharacterized protein LOC123532262 [Mercenaria mercenaria]XP_053374408.1 uncharacterized protein LOC123532262 [Mercenaria mercenaria]XP_053374409.1 uncharacterized protein LOC123532262 [Mercenaria mercenaria]XP_053374410.1 uncharacterized protein LOC123532262 [Mercenaria mercenaria]XP_053374411.1 uncharacterized protein LOC123532262 [Mercenaria mercenaria]XP_053374412.1 uncharacterized protein LOC123532262 [Mercenaria mercenaria]
MATSSVSVQWRVEGNSHYRSVSDSLAPVVRKARFQKALTCYETAHSAGTCDEEISSAAKNAGLTTWKLTKLAADTRDSWSVIKRYLKQSLKYFNQAYRTGTSCGKSDEWKDNILASCRGCWEEIGKATESLPKMDEEDRIITIRECIDFIPIIDMKADCYLEIAEFHFHRGVKAIAVGEYKKCLCNMHDCYYPLAEAVKHGRNIERIHKEHAVLEADVFMNTAIAESIQSRETGDALLEKVLMDEETLNIDMVWEVIDWYKNAILKVRDIDMKQEAMALHKIGVVYDKVFKIKFRAKIYLKKALELAQSMVPQCFASEDWYKECTSILERYQKETVQYEQEKDNKEREEARKKLKPEIDEIDKHESDTVLEFLRFVYKKYPRKNEKHKLDVTDKTSELSFDQRYKLLQQAVIHFHPDRVRVDEEGLEAKVLSEEVTKRLTKRYETIKSQK